MSRRKRRALNKLALAQLHCSHPHWAIISKHKDHCVSCHKERERPISPDDIFITKSELRKRSLLYFIIGASIGGTVAIRIWGLWF